VALVAARRWGEGKFSERKLRLKLRNFQSNF
jgi:hypothetical protein